MTETRLPDRTRGAGQTSPARVTRIVPVGTMGEAISLRVSNRPAPAVQVVKQIETPRSPDPIMRRPRTDREEKRVTRGSDIPGPGNVNQEQLASGTPIREGSQGLTFWLVRQRTFGGIELETPVGELNSVVSDVEGAIASGDPNKRVSMLRQMTSLFTAQAPRLNEAQISAFDQVILRLSRNIEARARADLSASLADVANAPRQVVRDLAYDPSADVAGPVLERSPRLDDSDLVQIASGAGQQHLMALSRRGALAESVTDVIVSRGNDQVMRRVAGNQSAQFSAGGFQILAKHAQADAELGRVLTKRSDIPETQRSQLITMARERAQQALATEFDENAAAQATLAIAESLAPPPADYTPIEVAVARQAKFGLDETTVQDWLATGETSYALVALARLAGVPSAIAFNAHAAPTTDPLLFLVRSVRFGWKTLKLLMVSRADGTPDAEAMQSAFQAFQELSVATAQRVVRFTAAREKLEQPRPPSIELATR